MTGSALTGTVDPWRYSAHPDIWLVVAVSAFALLVRPEPRRAGGVGGR